MRAVRRAASTAAPVDVLARSAGTQDLPPIEGFPKFKYHRYIPARGPAGWLLFVAYGVYATYTFYKQRVGMDIKWELGREEDQATMHLQPFLEAEKDRMLLRSTLETKNLERILMQNHPDWKVSELEDDIFYSKRWVRQILPRITNSDIYRYPIFQVKTSKTVF